MSESDPASPLPQQPSPEWTALLSSLPEDAVERLSESTKDFTQQQWTDLLWVWRQLQDEMSRKGETVPSCIDAAYREADNKTNQSLAVTLLIVFASRRLQDPTTHPSESELNDQIRLCSVLLKTFGFKHLPPLTLRLYSRPRQSFPESFEQEITHARELEDRLIQFFERVHAGKEAPLSDPDEKRGAFILTLVFDAGVLSVSELRAILATRNEPVRAVEDQHYIWLKLAESHSSVQEYRRVLLPELSAALAISGMQPTSEKEPSINIKKGLRAIGRRLGYRSKDRLSIKHILRGAGARLHAQRAVPQYVVDYCEYTLHSNSLMESAWRRLHGYEPWPDAAIGEASIIPESAAEKTESEETIADTSRDVLGQVARIFKSSASTQESLEQISAIRKQFNDDTYPRSVIPHLLDWLLELHKTISRSGKVRRIHTIRNLFTALAPRLIAGVGLQELKNLDEDDWQSMLDLTLDEQISESWRSTIRYSFWNFLRFMEQRGTLTIPVMSGWVGRMASNVNANVLSHAEFQRCIEEIKVGCGPTRQDEGRLMTFLLVLGHQLGLRKSEGLGITPFDVDQGPRPSLSVVNNQHRTLKTASSERRLPLGLLDERYRDALLKVAARPEDPTVKMIDAYQTGVETDSTIRKLNQVIQLVTADRTTSYHTLRHSAATWTLIALCAESLQLARLTPRFPFLTDALKRAKSIRGHLRGQQSGLHDLHAVKQLLGHRHEEMTLQHYIHCMDFLRYAAATLGREQPSAKTLMGAAGITRDSRSLRNSDKAAAISHPLKFIEARFPGHVYRHDVKLTPKEPTLSVQIKHNTTLRNWINTSKQSAEQPASSVNRSQLTDTSKLNSVVTLINETKVLGAPPRKMIQTLDEIKPTVRAELRLALGLARAMSADQGSRFDHATLSRKLLSAALARGFGWYKFASIASAGEVIEWLQYLGEAAGFKVVFGKDVNTTDQVSKKRRRHVLEFSDLKSLTDAGASRILLRLQLSTGGQRKSFPHSTFVWSLGMRQLTGRISEGETLKRLAMS